MHWIIPNTVYIKKHVIRISPVFLISSPFPFKISNVSIIMESTIELIYDKSRASSTLRVCRSNQTCSESSKIQSDLMNWHTFRTVNDLQPPLCQVSFTFANISGVFSETDTCRNDPIINRLKLLPSSLMGILVFKSFWKFYIS